MDNHAKAFGADRFGGYLVLWGTQKAKDVTGEFFTSHTQEMKSVFDAMGRLPVLYHHAADSTLKSQVIGHIDLMQPDEVGLWVEAQATKADLYRRMVKPLLDKGLLGWSSGTFPRAKEVKATGEITRWPIMEGSLTPTPADPRQMMRPVAAVKAAFVEIGLDADALKAYDDPTTAPDTDESIALLNLERERLAILELETQLAETVEKAGTFDESKHPRYPKGHPLAGQFMPAYTRNTADLQKFWETTGAAPGSVVQAFKSGPRAKHLTQFANLFGRAFKTELGEWNAAINKYMPSDSADERRYRANVDSMTRKLRAMADQSPLLQKATDLFLESYAAPSDVSETLKADKKFMRLMQTTFLPIGDLY